MKIAYLHRFDPELFDGSRVHVEEITSRWAAAGHSLVTLAPHPVPNCELWSEDDFQRRGSEIDVFYVRIHGSKSNDKLTELRRYQPAAVCVWEVNAPIEEKRLEGMSRFRLMRLNRRRKKAAKEVNGAVAVSAEMEAYARQQLGIATTIVIPNGADPQRFGSVDGDSRNRPRPGSEESGPFRVLWAGTSRYRWQALHRAESLAQQVEQRDLNARIVVTADGASRSSLEYLGHLARQDMPAAMAGCHAGLCLYEDVTYFPTFYFSPIKLFEYMASGLAVIGQDVGQIREVITQHQCGLLTDGSLDDLADKVQQLASDPAESRRMGERGRQAVLSTYNWDRAAQRTEEFLVELGNGKGREAGSAS